MDVVSLLAARSRGLSALELLVTLTVAGIGTSIAIPYWKYSVESSEVNAARLHLFNVLQSARATAVTMADDISLCPSNDGVSCRNAYTQWQTGYLLFHDSNANRSREATETVLASGKLDRRVEIQTSTGRRRLRFRADGSAWGSNVTFKLCSNSNANLNRAIIIHGSGRIRPSKTLSNGRAISC